MLTGEPGIGKTRLAQEVSLEAGRRGFLVASGRCYEPEQEVPFYPILEVLTTAYSTAPRAIRDEIPGRWPYLGWLLPEDVLPAAAPARSAWASGVGEEQRLFWAVSSFLGAVAQDMPVVVLLDDLHWADGASLKLLLHLARHTRSDRILLLGTYQDIELGLPGTPGALLARALVDLNRERLVERVSVHRLDQQGTADLIVSTMGDMEVSPEFAALIHRGTDGNPFFIQEVLRALVERGEIYQEDGRWTSSNIREFRAPETVRAAIGERLARLHGEAQAVLHRASVLGQTFAFDDLRALGSFSEEELEEALDAAVSAGLIREEGMSGYAFNHSLTRQALYEDLSMRRRRTLHLAAGEALQRLPESVRRRRAAELAWHFREGGDRERAVEYTMLAGDQAVEVFAYGEAERHFRSAVDLASAEDAALADATLRSQALTKLGRVLDLTEHYEEALPALEQAAEEYRIQGDVAREGAAVAEIGWIHRNRGTDEEGLARVEPVVARLEHESTFSGQHQVLAGLYTALSRLFFGLGRYADELYAAERAAQLAREVGDQLVLSVAQARRGAALMTLGRREEARAALEESIALAQATGNLGTMTVALDNLGEIARDGGDYRQGQRDCERAVELAEQIGVPGRIAWTLTKLGRIHLLKGEWALARAILERALGLLGDDLRSAAFPRIHLGQMDLLEGNWEKGSAQVEAAMRAEAPGRDLWLRRHGQRLLAERDLLDGQSGAALARLTPLVEQPGGGEPHGTVIFTLLFAPLAWAYLELKQEAAAEAALAEGAERAQAQNHRLAQADLLRVQGMLRTRQGRWQEAWEALEGAISLAQDMPDPYREVQGRAEAGNLAARTGDLANGRKHLQEALAVAQRLGAHPYIRRIRHSLVQLDRD
jgi:tetratricopeptide (TPR) repeat protein